MTQKRSIMRRAHELRRETGFAFGDCLRQSWSESKGAPRWTDDAMEVVEFVSGVATNYRKYVGGSSRLLSAALAAC